MKNIAAQMVNFDREQMRRIANNMPEQYDEKPQVQQVAQIINGVFSQLLATFPASLANRDQNELNEIRRQWVLAFRENGITTMEQVNAGMRVAKSAESTISAITRAVCCMVPGRSIRYRRTAKRQRAG